MTEGTNQASRCPIQDGFFISPSGKRQRLEDIRAIQTNMLKEPSFPDSQKSTMNIRSLGRFGKPITFAETFADMAVGAVCPILIKFCRSYNPINPTMQDLRRSISGGYAQQCVHLTLAHVVHSGKCGRTLRFVFLTASLFSNSLTNPKNKQRHHRPRGPEVLQLQKRPHPPVRRLPPQRQRKDAVLSGRTLA